MGVIIMKSIIVAAAMVLAATNAFAEETSCNKFSTSWWSGKKCVEQYTPEEQVRINADMQAEVLKRFRQIVRNVNGMFVIEDTFGFKTLPVSTKWSIDCSFNVVFVQFGN